VAIEEAIISFDVEGRFFSTHGAAREPLHNQRIRVDDRKWPDIFLAPPPEYQPVGMDEHARTLSGCAPPAYVRNWSKDVAVRQPSRS
jgi:hypothetical protein